jgi:hypothetical protein
MVGWRAMMSGVLGLVLAVPAVAVLGGQAHAYGLLTLTARHSGKCADVVSGSTADGAEVAQYPCNGGTNQLWGLRDLGNGYVQLVAHHSGKCLDVAGSSTADGARVLQWTCHSGTNQQWQLQDAGSGYLRLVARHSGKCADVTGGATADGARVLQWSCNGGTNQQWRRDGVGSPVLPGLYADPNIVVFGDTFYLYPTTDGFPGWSGTQFRAFSSKDLVTWTDHGVILDLGPDVSWADNSAWAPAIAERNGEYYFYFSGGLATGDTRKHLGVAVSDSPTGPFRDALGRPLVAAGTYSGQMIDPAVFTDDDGRPYLYWGQGTSYQVPLGGDMVSFDAAQVRSYRPSNYNEGTFVFKRNGIYYFTWSENDTRSEDYRVAYATGTSPLGPWSGRIGVILQKDTSRGILGTGHHSVVRVPGTDDWYVAYHRFAIPGGDGTHRETTIDRMFVDPDGTIRPVVPTLESVDPVALP